MKKKIKLILLPTLLFSLCACSSEEKVKDKESYIVKETLTDTYNMIENKVVYIKSYTGEDYEVGSGVAFKEDETYVYFLTNKHVVSTISSLYVDHYENVEVRFKDGTVEAGTIVGSYKEIDVAVVKVEKEKITGSYSLANIDVNSKIGETVVAYGNPMMIPFVMSSGIVSNLYSEVDFTVDGLGKYYGIQIDASINPGNSGGGLFDVDGNLLGIVQGGISDRNGIGYAIPIGYANHVANKLIENGSYTVNDYGFEYKDLSEVNYEMEGISTSIKAGIYVTSGDYAGKIIKSINGKEIKSIGEMYMLRFLSEGAYTITYINKDGTDFLE